MHLFKNHKRTLMASTSYLACVGILGPPMTAGAPPGLGLGLGTCPSVAMEQDRQSYAGGGGGGPTEQLLGGSVLIDVPAERQFSLKYSVCTWHPCGHRTLNQRWFNTRVADMTLKQHYFNCPLPAGICLAV